MAEVLDYFSPHDRATMAAFKTGGIARYLTNSPNDPRQVTPQEIADAHALGLSVHFFYEMNPTYPAYFTFGQGAEDCRQAQARLGELGAPDRTVVYFTVDTNIEPSLTVAYFNGVESVVTPKIDPGGYGYQRFCEFAYRNFPAIGKHLWQTYGVPSVPLDGFQHLQENRAGVSIDVNDVSAPGWRAPSGVTTGTLGDMTRDETIALLAEYGLVDKYKFPSLQTETEALYHHQHPEPPNLGKEPLVPPVPGAVYFGADATFTVVGWKMPDGTTKYYKNGVPTP